jgi:5-(aminomethyl)-3-furanmethanol phosphate kinase
VTLAVVKVGGSFADAPDLPALLAELEAGAGRTVIVPGGGPFADVVRRKQRAMRFDDCAAHRMALLAMAQLGFALAALSPSLAPARDMDSIRKILDAGRLPVWLPLDLLDGHPDIPESWDMTSDSLAAWLANRLAAARVIFVKRVKTTASSLTDFVAEGAFDPLVPRFMLKAGCEGWLCTPADIRDLGSALAEGRGAGRRLTLARNSAERLHSVP